MAETDSSTTINRRLQKILKSIDRMRPMPANINRILSVLEDKDSTANKLGGLLGLDQALTANVLQAANSAILGYGPSCTNLSDAIMRLGFDRIRTIVLGVAVSGNMTGVLPGYRLGAGELWKHSISTAITAQWFARRINFPKPEDAYVAGLLHDMGKLMLDQFALADYGRLFELVKDYDLTFYQVEQKLFGIDHAHVGGIMAYKWNFPPVLINAIQHHHSPSKAENDVLAALVNIANAMAPMEKEILRKLGKREIHSKTLKILNIKPEDLEKIKGELMKIIEDNKDILDNNMLENEN